MKKVLLAIPLFAMAVVFAFCSKADPKPDPGALNSNVQTTHRGGGCMVWVYPLTYHPLTYCGTLTNDLACSTCVGNATGEETVSGDFSFELPAPQSFSISSDFSTSVIILTETNQIGPISIPANGCEVFTVDGNCSISN